MINKTSLKDLMQFETPAVENTYEADDFYQDDEELWEEQVEEDNDEEKSLQINIPAELIEPIYFLVGKGVVRKNEGKRSEKYYRLLRDHSEEVQKWVKPLKCAFVVDHKNASCHLRKVVEDDTTYTGTKMGLVQSMVFVIIRLMYNDKIKAGHEKVYFDLSDILEELKMHWVPKNSQSTDERDIRGKLKKVAERNIIKPVKGTQDRYEIMSDIIHAIPLEKAIETKAAYQKITVEKENV